MCCGVISNLMSQFLLSEFQGCYHCIKTNVLTRSSCTKIAPCSKLLFLWYLFLLWVFHWSSTYFLQIWKVKISILNGFIYESRTDGHLTHQSFLPHCLPFIFTICHSTLDIYTLEKYTLKNTLWKNEQKKCKGANKWILFFWDHLNGLGTSWLGGEGPPRSKIRK